MAGRGGGSQKDLPGPGGLYPRGRPLSGCQGPTLADVGQSEEQGLQGQARGHPSAGLSPQGREARVPAGSAGPGMLLMLLPAEPPMMDRIAAQTAPGPGGGRRYQVGGGARQAAAARWRSRQQSQRKGAGAGTRLWLLREPLGSEAKSPKKKPLPGRRGPRAWGAASRGWSATGVGCSRTEGPEAGQESGPGPGGQSSPGRAGRVPRRERTQPPRQQRLARGWRRQPARGPQGAPSRS